MEPIEYLSTFSARIINAGLLPESGVCQVFAKQFGPGVQQDAYWITWKHKWKHKNHNHFQINDKVLIKSLRIPKAGISNAKLLPGYEGPYLVIKKIFKSTYLLEKLDGTERGMFHANILKKYYD